MWILTSGGKILLNHCQRRLHAGPLRQVYSNTMKCLRGNVISGMCISSNIHSVYSQICVVHRCEDKKSPDTYGIEYAGRFITAALTRLRPKCELKSAYLVLNICSGMKTIYSSRIGKGLVMDESTSERHEIKST